VLLMDVGPVLGTVFSVKPKTFHEVTHDRAPFKARRQRAFLVYLDLFDLFLGGSCFCSRVETVDQFELPFAVALQVRCLSDAPDPAGVRSVRRASGLVLADNSGVNGD
jgi:hypothetical protein